MQFDSLLKGSDFDLWMVVAQRSLDRAGTASREALTEVQRVAASVWAASGLIGNRGFFDHSPETMCEWSAAYDALGLTQAAEAIRDAARIMPGMDWDGDDPAERQLDEIEGRYYAADEQTAGAVAALIRQRSAEAFAGLA